MQLKRESRSETVEGSSLGKSHIAQVVNALENHRLNHEHEYPRDHETRVSLRKDVRIRAFESASKHNEPSRIKKSQAIKAAGTTSGVSSQLAATSVVVIADGGCTRHVLQGGAFPVLALGADRLLGETSHLRWSA